MEEEKEIDSKEVSDALHMLLHCSLKDTEYETQKQQFEIVNAYIKKLEKENEEWQRAYQEEKDKQFELLRENKELKEEECCMTTCLRKDKERVFFENKVKEKIEEIKLSLKDDCLALHEFQRIAKIDVLEELLES